MATPSATNKTKQKLSQLRWLLVFITPIMGFGIDIYTPSLPIITHLLNTSHTAVKLTISIYILGFGLGQLVIGPLSDRIGRKSIMVSSLMLFIIASLLIVTSKSILFFVIMRSLQGLAAAGQILNVRAISVDLFDGHELRKSSIYTTTAWTLSPIIGPAIGGHLQTYFNWQAGFYFLAIYTLLILVITLIMLPETNANKHRINLTKISQNYLSIFKSWAFMKNVYGLGIGFSIINAFNVLGPFIVEIKFAKTPLFYAYVSLLIGVGGFIGSLINRAIMKSISTHNVILIALLGAITVSVISCLLSVYFNENLIMIVLPSVLITVTVGLIYSNYSAHCLNMFKHIAGTAAAVRGVGSMIVAAVITALISLIPINSTLSLLVIYLVLSIIALLIFLFKKDLNSTKEISHV